jgi:CheY-like chemotaxis protein
MTAKINIPIDDRTCTRKTILLVEDDQNDEELTLRALRRSNIKNEVVVAHDGQEALDILFGEEKFIDGEADMLPAVVLLDLKLPKISGIEVLRRIRSEPRTRRLPVVILTSSRLERDRDQAYDLGVNSFITKPVDFENFCDAIGHLGMYWVLLNEQPPVHEIPKAVAT